MGAGAILRPLIVAQNLFDCFVKTYYMIILDFIRRMVYTEITNDSFFERADYYDG